MSQILITGSNGQLGSEFRYIAGNYQNHTFTFTDVEELDITDRKAVHSFFQENSFDFCVNCAGYTAVDQAEDEPEKAFRLNTDAVENLAMVCENNHTRFIHISTDYVFDGTAKHPYKEDDTVSPQSVYGFSKLKGEEAVLMYSSRAVIIRTAWLCSQFGKNFVKTMLRLGAERSELRVVDDQIGSPTFANDLARAILEMIGKTEKPKSTEIYHYSSMGHISWFIFAKEIMKMAGQDCKIIPVKTSEYPTKAKRPAYSVLDKSKIIHEYGIEIPEWKFSLLKLIESLKNA
ncbi:MAG: dTDP-4-dehydrorhamnose reductase [Bacteroidetes bacterium]|nr:dTDP-4-dehydrorhamnose reductase [Bacteroidota bacterium]